MRWDIYIYNYMYAVKYTRLDIYKSVDWLSLQLLRWFAPAIVAIASGIFLAVVSPCVGCCILCCRMSGHCGSKSRHYRKRQQNTKCFIMTIIFLLGVFMIL